MNKKIYDTAVIGAGASGLMAAITAARAGLHPILLEHMEQPAKKILATGNGKCNFTNADWDITNYYCSQPEFVQTVLAQFSYADTIHFFEELGIRPIQKNGTCIYPESGQASSVRSALLAEAGRLKVPCMVSLGIRHIYKENVSRQQLFHIEAKGQELYSRTCILATGGKAAKKTGSDGSGYLYARQLGHTVIEPFPALSALTADFKKDKLPAGVRIECMAALLVDGQTAACERGELQITDYGISGIVIFQISRIAALALSEHKQVFVRLDFKPDMIMEELSDYLYQRFHSLYHAQKTAGDCCIGFLPDKLIPVILKRAALSFEKVSGTFSQKEILRLAHAVKNYEAAVTGTKGFDAAQVTAGGIPVHEINPHTMESRLVPGLYFAGEIVDVDAKCGGYNLQWAWSSGYTAGKSQAQKEDI